MTRHTTPVLHVLLLATALLAASGAMRAQVARDTELGLIGYVLAPDGTPVSSGSVLIQSRGVRTITTSIERTGRFRVVPNQPGIYQVLVTVADLASYRVNVIVPPSRTLRLPVIRLSPATYFRVRFISVAGETIPSPQLRRQSLDVTGLSIPSTDSGVEHVDSDGALTIGPLPLGITLLALDMPPLAQTRLPDLVVTGGDTLIDGGTMTVQPGAVLHIDVVDATGAPVPQHDVWLEDFLLPSPLSFRPVRTDQQGRATFERLGAGRYRLRTAAAGRCVPQRLSAVSITRVVDIPGSGILQTRLVIGGQATFSVTSPALGPLRGNAVSASPDAGLSGPPTWLRSRADSPSVVRPGGPFTFQPGCVTATDGDGRVTLTNFPPGPARIEVQLLNSKYVRRVTVPEDGREFAVVIPDGYLPLRVTDAVKNSPVAAANVVWTGGGARVEATTPGNGEVLLAGVGTAPGTLAITAGGYQPVETKLPEPPAMLHEVAMTPTPSARVDARVITSSGEPLPAAVVALSPENPMELGQIGVTDAKGFVRFFDAPPGMLRLVANADGFIPVGVQIGDHNRGEISLTLSRGYRVIASVESPAATGSHLVRVVNEAGTSMDALLDVASDRRIEPPGQISLGPLPAGNYIVELQGPRERSQQRIRIVDRDVYTTFR